MKHKVETIPAEEILANRSNAYEFIDVETLEEPKQEYEYESECICDGECREFVNVKCKKLKQQETLEEDFKIWDDLFGILAWKFKPTKSGDMYLDGEKVYEELKSKFKLKRIWKQD